MHLGNGAITPECGLVALGVAAAGAGIAFVSARGLGLDRARARTAGALGAAVFAAQLFNVQILPFSSVHLIGGVLLAWVLGPALGALTMAGILSLQTLLLGDGGLLALGANIVNMGLLPAIAVAGVRRYGPATANAAQTALVLALTACLATLAGAALIVLEVASGRSGMQLQGLGEFAAAMLGAHALAGVLEGAATVAVVALTVGISQRSELGLRLSAPRAGAVTVVSLAIALCASLGLGSSRPDAYQAALAAVGQSGPALSRIEATDQLAGISAVVQSWQDAVVSAFAAPETVLFVLATLTAGAVAWASASLCVRSRGWSVG